MGDATCWMVPWVSLNMKDSVFSAVHALDPLLCRAPALPSADGGHHGGATSSNTEASGGPNEETPVVSLR